jgi:hypothetical protein
VNAIDEAQVLARKIPGISDETLSRACCPHRRRSDVDLDTIGLQWLLVAQTKMSTTTAGELARIIYENKTAPRTGRWLRHQDRAGTDRQGRLRNGA